MIASISTQHLSTQYAVGWFTLSLSNAGLAQGKGRSGINWWLLSWLLGPVATFLVVVLDPVTSKLSLAREVRPGLLHRAAHLHHVGRSPLRGPPREAHPFTWLTISNVSF